MQVWASKWSDRAWLSRRARGVADTSLFMAVLLQQASCCWPPSGFQNMHYARVASTWGSPEATAAHVTAAACNATPIKTLQIWLQSLAAHWLRMQLILQCQGL